jgi:hypothetical protein
VPAGGINSAPVSDDEAKQNLDDKQIKTPKAAAKAPAKK